MKDMDPEILSEEDRLRTCAKNPGHEKFIPVTNFYINHLPAPLQNAEVFEHIRTLAALTVRIFVQRTKTSYYGTGVICEVENHASKLKCFCLHCQSSDQLFNNVWYICVTTAAHLISQDQVPSRIRADVFYDSQLEKDKIRTLYGYRVVEKCDRSDICKIIFITHDDELGDKLNQHVHSFREYVSSQQILSTNEKYAVIVSHPHGSSKKVSIGTLSTSSGRGKTASILESQLVNIEVEVHFPDGECSKRMIWMLDRKVKDTKEFLLKEAGIKDNPEIWNLAMHYYDDGIRKMDDNLITRDYINDLTDVKYVEFILSE